MVHLAIILLTIGAILVLFGWILLFSNQKVSNRTYELIFGPAIIFLIAGTILCAVQFSDSTPNTDKTVKQPITHKG